MGKTAQQMPIQEPEARPGRSTSKRTRQEQIAVLKARLEKLETDERNRARRMDTRQKIVIGGTVLAAMREDANLARVIVKLLRERVTRPLDQEAIAEWLKPDTTD